MSELNERKSLLRELPFYGANSIEVNNDHSNIHTKMKELNKLSSLYDMESYNLNPSNFSSINPDQMLLNHQIHTFYYSSNRFKQLQNSLSEENVKSSLSIFHNNVRSLKRNLENLKVQLLDQLDFHFNIIGITETKITNSSELNFKTQIPGYEFEYVPTPLASGGVGMYIDNTLEYIVLEKCANDAFQALWIEIINCNKKNIICGIIYCQHNDPNRFMNYLDETVEKFSLTGKSLCVMGDFNVDLLKSDTCNYAQNFLLSCHSYSLLPSIDKPSRIYNDSATLIDNILVNTLDHQIHSGNIISDISDHFSQFCIIHSVRNISKSTRGQKMRDFSKFSESKFMNEEKLTGTQLFKNINVMLTNYSHHFIIN